MAETDWTESMTNNWISMQKQYWDTWSNMVQAAAENPQSSIDLSAWSKSFADWWDGAASTAAPVGADDVLQRVSDMGKMYMSMAEKMYDAVSQLEEESDKDPIEFWMAMMEGGFGDWAQQIAQGFVPEDAEGIGPMHFEGWQKVLNSLGVEHLASMGSFSLGNPQSWQDQLRKMLSTPGVGYNRESQEQLQALARMVLDYREAENNYLAAFAEQGKDSILALREKVVSLAEEGKEIKTLRELFDLWVNVNEEVYAEFAMSEEYQVIYGDMVNAFMQLKGGINDQVELLYKAANLPTRSEFNAALKKQQQLKRDNRYLRQAMRDLEGRMNALDGGSAAAQKPATQPAASKKQAAKAAAAPAKKPAAKQAAGKKQPAKAAAKPAKKPAAKQAKADDLTKLKGLGAKMQDKFYELGIKTYADLSAVEPAQLEELDKKLGSRGRLLRDDWVGQAKAILNQDKNS